MKTQINLKEGKIRDKEEINFFSEAQKLIEKFIMPNKEEALKNVFAYMRENNFNFNEILLMRQMLSEAFSFELTMASIKDNFNKAKKE